MTDRTQHAKALITAFDWAILEATEILQFAKNGKADLLRQNLDDPHLILSYAEEKAQAIERRFSSGSDRFYKVLND